MKAFRVSVLTLVAALPAFATMGDALIEAAREDDVIAVGRLVSQGADVNARDEDGATPLALAADHSNVAVAQLLLNKGADPDLTNGIGIGPQDAPLTDGDVAWLRDLADELEGEPLEDGTRSSRARIGGEDR